ncbi:MAG: glycosyltransferase family 2 protein, partial [Candidatus Spyradenecus sp.]
MKPIFSIIVPAYNVADYLPAALASIQAQDIVAWECLCVDDGSTDGTAEVLQHYAETDARFRLFRQENAGVSVARNRALQEAKGEWILFLDGDDLLAPGLLSALQHATDTTPPPTATMRYGRLRKPKLSARRPPCLAIP